MVTGVEIEGGEFVSLSSPERQMGSEIRWVVKRYVVDFVKELSNSCFRCDSWNAESMLVERIEESREGFLLLTDSGRGFGDS